MQTETYLITGVFVEEGQIHHFTGFFKTDDGEIIISGRILDDYSPDHYLKFGTAEIPYGTLTEKDGIRIVQFSKCYGRSDAEVSTAHYEATSKDGVNFTGEYTKARFDEKTRKTIGTERGEIKFELKKL